MSSNGAVRLARLNVNVEQELAMALKLTQIPTVFGVFSGGIVSSFVGVPDDNTLDNFSSLMVRVGGHEELVAMSNDANAALERGEMEAARNIFQEILHANHLGAEALALAGLIRCAVKEGKLDEAEELAHVIQTSYPKDANAPEVLQALTALELAKSTGSTAASGLSIEELKSKIEANPTDFESRLALASTYWSTSQQQAAINTLLDAIKLDKHWNDDAAKKLLFKFFDSLGSDHPLTLTSRKRFGLIWF